MAVSGHIPATGNWKPRQKLGDEDYFLKLNVYERLEVKFNKSTGFFPRITTAQQENAENNRKHTQETFKTNTGKREKAPNVLANLDKAVMLSVKNALEDTADELVEETRALLKEKHGDGPAWTGELYNSICRSDVSGRQGKYRVSFYADAKNPNNGALYAEFLEDGTGDKGTHTGPTWRYQDRNGHWWTTSGMAADPFLEPPTHAFLERLKERTKSEVSSAIHYSFYATTKSMQEKLKATAKGG